MAMPATAEYDGEVDLFGVITDIISSGRVDSISDKRTMGQRSLPCQSNISDTLSKHT